MLLCKIQYRIHISRMPVDVNHHNRFGSGRQRCSEMRRIEVPVVRIRIEQNGSGTTVADRKCGGDHRKCWENYFISRTNSQSLQSQMKSDGSVWRSRAILHAHVG